MTYAELIARSTADAAVVAARAAAQLAANRTLRGSGVAMVEVIQTGYQTGLESELVRPWDGTPSMIGTIEPRNGRADGTRTIRRGIVSIPW